MLLDPLANSLSIIKNAEKSGKPECILKPASKLIGNTLRVFYKKGYIGEFEFIEDGHGGRFKVKLIGKINNCGVIKPRFSVKMEEFNVWEERYLPAKNVGSMIISTPKGIISHQEAEDLNTGGVLIAFVY
ncbi:MAG TPA: 30S ribosomal protein S8 [Halobacteria archaeon]|nr:30S ribosomal protein S8 [Halobacteria archaeon]